MKRKYKAGRVWPGELTKKEDRTPALREFFEAIKRKTPELLESLRDKVLPLFKRVINGKVVSDQEISPEMCREPWFLELYPRVWDWAKEYHLVAGDRLMPPFETCEELNRIEGGKKVRAAMNTLEMTFFFPWVWFAFVTTMAGWLSNRGKKKKLIWALPLRALRLSEVHEILEGFMPFGPFSKIKDLFTPYKLYNESVLVCKAQAWDPFQETRSVARDRIFNDLELQVENHLNLRAELATVSGAISSPGKFNRDHFDWLALYQIKGRRFAQIAEEVGETYTQTVTDGVKSAAESVVGPRWKDWLRPSQSGRPRSS